MAPRIFFNMITILVLTFLTNTSSAEPRGPLLGIDSSSKYLIYYGGDFSQQNVDIMKTFDIIVLHPSSYGVTPRLVKELQDAGVSYVLGYISVGEDSLGLGELPIIQQGKGPIYKDETTQKIVYQNQGIASFYLDSVYNYSLAQYEHDSVPDVNGVFGGYFIYPNSDWREVLNEMRIGGSAGIFTQRQYLAGLKQIAGQRDLNDLNNKFSNFGFDGFFLDTIDTAGPYTAEGWYPWVAEAMQETVKFISDSYPNKVVLANRGSFYYQAGLHNTTYNVSPIDFSIRPYINAMLFESYMLDSAASHTGISPYFLDNHKSVAPKLMAEANRPDGFTITNMDYMMNRGAELYDQLFMTVVKEQGWVTYLTLTGVIDTIDLNFPQKLNNEALMEDISPPQWMHTGEYSFENRSPRIGVQQLKKGDAAGELTVFWDSAKDQSWPIHYNITIATQEDFSDQVKHNHVVFKKNPAWNNNPVANVANQFTLTGLTGSTYYVRVTAEDSSTNQLEDDNTVTLSTNLSLAVSNPITQSPTINGNLDEWQTLQSFGTDAKDISRGNTLDWKQAWIAHTDDTLYFAYQYHKPIRMSWGHITYLDTDTNADTGYKGASNTMPIGVEYMIQGYNLWKYTGNGNNWAWQFISGIGRSWSTHGAEMYFPRAWIGNPERISLYYEGNNASLGQTSVDLFPDTVNSEDAYFSYSLTE